MPKMKTKSGAKKRFRFTATGKVKAGAAGKRHGMIKRTAKFVQKARGTMVLNDSDAGIVKKYMPYNRRLSPHTPIETEHTHGTRQTRRYRPRKA
mgnify:CR=1 FL=1